jgi:hypothetical protein
MPGENFGKYVICIAYHKLYANSSWNNADPKSLKGFLSAFRPPGQGRNGTGVPLQRFSQRRRRV